MTTRTGSKIISRRPTRNELERLYIQQRMSTRAIGIIYKVKHISVRRWLTYYNIPLRPAGRGLQNRGIREPTKEELHQLVHIKHESHEQIGKRFGVDGSAVRHWLIKFNIPRPERWTTRKKRTTTLPAKAELKEMYNSGMSLVEIGKLYGLTDGPISRLCKKFNIPVRKDGWQGGKRFECNDGHSVRSTYELKVDNWLHANSIKHEYEPCLPINKRFRADFIAENMYIEVWGVINSPRYKAQKNKKKRIYKEAGYTLIEIPAHAFAQSRGNAWERILERAFQPNGLFQTLSQSLG